MSTPKIVTHDEWLAARKALLEKEKAFTRERDALTAARQAMPLERVEKSYSFQGEDRSLSLAELFGGKRQLLVYHFMFAPSWEAGCRSCSLVAESFDRVVVHLAARDTAFYAISRAPYAKLHAYRARMGWTFPWVSSHESDFNFDYQVSFREEDVAKKSVLYNYTRQSFGTTDAPGFSTFLRDGDDVLHAYSSFGRGVDMLMNVYNLLDLTPLGRQEDGKGQFWVRRRDEYDAAP
jgi:predicted dithiol-disulfide oxidoreductase (DUF899 family)